MHCHQADRNSRYFINMETLRSEIQRGEAIICQSHDFKCLVRAIIAYHLKEFFSKKESQKESWCISKLRSAYLVSTFELLNIGSNIVCSASFICWNSQIHWKISLARRYLLILNFLSNRTNIGLNLITKWISAHTSLLLQSKEPPISVLHVQYPEWPDHGVPEDTLAVREIFKRVSIFPPSVGPIVVHCRFVLNNIYIFFIYIDFIRE